MKLVTFSVLNAYPRQERIGAVEGDKVIDLAAAYRAWLLDSGKSDINAVYSIAGALLPHDMTAFLEGGDVSMEAARQAVAFAKNVSVDIVKEEKICYSSDEVKLHAPVPRPRLLRDFILFEDHLKNGLRMVYKRRGETPPENLEVPPIIKKIPIYYKGNPSTIIGPEETVVWPSYSKVMDYELEFACVIGKRGRDISAKDASKYIAGFTIFNDWSARDKQIEESEGGLGPAKGKDFCTAIGPYLVTPDEIENVYNLNMEVRVNGELRGQGNSGAMLRTFEEIIEYVSQSETLVPGDILASGTVGSGSGFEMGRQLEDGDVVELTIGSLGTLRNRVIFAKSL